MDKLARKTTTDHVVIALREMIVDGRLPEARRINEVLVASALGVSRTPLREGLARLEAEGAIKSVPHLGYFVQPLSLEEYQQIYPIRALLDPEALSIAGIPSPAKLRELSRLNNEMRKATQAEDILKLDDAWHRELISECPNLVLLDLIVTFTRRARRYELALMRDGAHVQISTREHAQVIAALRAGDLSLARERLRENMLTGVEAVTGWLRKRERSAPPRASGRASAIS